MKKQVEPASRNLDTQESYDKFIAKDDPVVVGKRLTLFVTLIDQWHCVEFTASRPTEIYSIITYMFV